MDLAPGYAIPFAQPALLLGFVDAVSVSVAAGEPRVARCLSAALARDGKVLIRPEFGDVPAKRLPVLPTASTAAVIAAIGRALDVRHFVARAQPQLLFKDVLIVVLPPRRGLADHLTRVDVPDGLERARHDDGGGCAERRDVC